MDKSKEYKVVSPTERVVCGMLAATLAAGSVALPAQGFAKEGAPTVQKKAAYEQPAAETSLIAAVPMNEAEAAAALSAAQVTADDAEATYHEAEERKQVAYDEMEQAGDAHDAARLNAVAVDEEALAAFEKSATDAAAAAQTAQANLDAATTTKNEAEQAATEKQAAFDAAVAEQDAAQKALEKAQEAADSIGTADVAAAQTALDQANAAVTAAQSAYENTQAQSAAAQAAVVSAQAAYDDATAEAQIAQSAVPEAQSEYDAAQAAVASAQEAYDAALAAADDGSPQVVAAKQTLANAQSALSKAQAARDSAQSSVDTAQASAAAAQQQLGAAQAKAEQAKESNEAAFAAISAAQADVDAKQKALDGATAQKNAAATDLAAAQKSLATAQDAKTKADAAVDTAKANLDAARVAADQAQAEIDKAQAAIDSAAEQFKAGSFGFFQEIGDTDALSALNDCKYASSIGKGQSWSSTTLENMQATIAFMKECNTLRASEGKSALKVNTYLMACAQADADWGYVEYKEDYSFDHARQFNVGENIALGYRDPFVGWYTEEKANYLSGTGQTGHYLNIINGKYDITGYAIASPNATRLASQTFQTQSWISGVGKTYTVDEFEKLLNDYTDAIYTKPQEKLDAAKAAFDTANKTIDAKKTVYNNSVIQQTTAGNALAAADGVVAGKQAALDTATAAVTTAQSASDNASTNLNKVKSDNADAAAAFDAAKAAVNDAKRNYDAATASVRANQATLDKAVGALVDCEGAAQSAREALGDLLDVSVEKDALGAAQKTATAKETTLKQKQAARDAASDAQAKAETALDEKTVVLQKAQQSTADAKATLGAEQAEAVTAQADFDTKKGLFDGVAHAQAALDSAIVKTQSANDTRTAALQTEQDAQTALLQAKDQADKADDLLQRAQLYTLDYALENTIVDQPFTYLNTYVQKMRDAHDEVAQAKEAYEQAILAYGAASQESEEAYDVYLDALGKLAVAQSDHDTFRPAAEAVVPAEQPVTVPAGAARSAVSNKGVSLPETGDQANAALALGMMGLAGGAAFAASRKRRRPSGE